MNRQYDLEELVKIKGLNYESTIHGYHEQHTETRLEYKVSNEARRYLRTKKEKVWVTRVQSMDITSKTPIRVSNDIKVSLKRGSKLYGNKILNEYRQWFIRDS